MVYGILFIFLYTHIKMIKKLKIIFTPVISHTCNTLWVKIDNNSQFFKIRQFKNIDYDISIGKVINFIYFFVNTKIWQIINVSHWTRNLKDIILEKISFVGFKISETKFRKTPFLEKYLTNFEGF